LPRLHVEAPVGGLAPAAVIEHQAHPPFAAVGAESGEAFLDHLLG
jgi:hypothetical protein